MMEHTNYSFLQSRWDHIQSNAEMKIASNRLSKGNRLKSDKRDAGALGVDATLRSSRIHDSAEKINLQNLHTFLQVQPDGLSRARTIYDRMGLLEFRVLDPTINERDNHQHNKELSELSSEPDKWVRKKANGNLLFGGKTADFTDGLTDSNATGTTPLGNSQDVQATCGKKFISLSPGGAADQIWVFQRKLLPEFDVYFDSITFLNDTEIFDPTNVARLEELNLKLYSHFETHGIIRTRPWQTEENANVNNFDSFEVKYDSSNLKATPNFDDDNRSSFGRTLYGNLVASGELRTNIPPGGSTTITLFGVNTGNTKIYKVKASFTPTLHYNNILISTSGQIFPAISFGNLGCSNISTEENANKVLSALDAELTNLTDSMSNIATAQSRYQSGIESLKENEVISENSISKISHTDFVQEILNFIKSKLKPEFSAQIISKKSRMKDILISLTTNYSRSLILSLRM